MNKVLKKAVSLVIAVALAIAVLPAMSLASATAGETTTFAISPQVFSMLKNGTSTSATIAAKDVESLLFNYIDKGDLVDIPYYHKDWKLFTIDNWRTDASDLTNANIYAAHGLAFEYGSENGWIALKVRGFKAGTYSLKVRSFPLRGRVIGLYVLDNETYGEKPENIAGAIATMSDGVQKVGSADFYGREGSAKTKYYDSVYSENSSAAFAYADAVLSEVEFGNAVFSGDETTEYILVFKDEGPGQLDGKEKKPSDSASDPTASRQRHISIATLSFTPTTATAKNADVFGNTAAFIEHTNDSSEAMLYLVSAIESVNYSKVGFNLKVDGISVDTDTTTTVYDSLTMSNDDGSTKEFTAADFGLNGGLLYVVSKKLDAGFTGQTIDFTPFAVKGEETITGSTYQATLKK
ncbi:MAG: hypothetical protein IJN09_02500 [Oscillospiraceae bacterium]|nr:hypothetical protein [Oscillospiraceae bacterium]